MRLAFWQRVASPHQAPFARVLAERLGAGAVTCYFRSQLYAELRQRGWEEPDYGAVHVVYLTDDRAPEAVVAASSADTIHVFSSLSHDPVLRRAFRAVVARGSVIGILSEPRDWRGWKGALRQLDSWRHERAWRRHVRFVLAMGSTGREWFRRCGYADSCIFEFCYVVAEPAREAPLAAPSDGTVRFTFVGQLIPRKRVDLLLDACAQLPRAGWSLDIIGSGALADRLAAQVAGLDLADRVHLRGTLSNQAVRQQLGASDVLVLPSYWDGWGAVVNEALCAGTPVVCSDHCGAAALIGRREFGRVFAEGSAGALSAALAEMVAAGPNGPERRASLRAYSRSFSGAAVADYLLEVAAAALASGSGAGCATRARHLRPADLSSGRRPGPDPAPRPTPPWRIAAGMPV